MEYNIRYSVKSKQIFLHHCTADVVLFSGPLSEVYLENLNRGQKARSVPGLELLARGSKPGGKKQRSDSRYLFLRTNARTICLENPVIANIRKSNDSEKRFSLPQDFYTVPFTLNAETEGNQMIVHKSYEGINHSEPNSLQVKTFKRTNNPDRVNANKSSYTTDLVKTFGSQTDCGYQAPVGQSRNALAKSCDEFFVGQPCRPSDHEISKQQQPKPQHSASYKRRAYSATVNFRKKNAAGSSKESDRVTKFILVDIDYDNRSGKHVDCEGRSARDANSFRAEWCNVERGRSRAAGEGHQDERRLAARSRSADSSISYLYEKMLANGNMKSGGQSTEGLLDHRNT